MATVACIVYPDCVPSFTIFPLFQRIDSNTVLRILAFHAVLWKSENDSAQSPLFDLFFAILTKIDSKTVFFFNIKLNFRYKINLNYKIKVEILRKNGSQNRHTLCHTH